MGPRSKTIRVSQEAYDKLKRLAEPLEDTPNTVIESSLNIVDWIIGHRVELGFEKEVSEREVFHYLSELAVPELADPEVVNVMRDLLRRAVEEAAPPEKEPEKAVKALKDLRKQLERTQVKVEEGSRRSSAKRSERAPTQSRKHRVRRARTRFLSRERRQRVEEDSGWARWDFQASGVTTGTRIILSPAAKTAEEHYENTIKRTVPLSRIKPLVTDEEYAELMQIYPEGQAHIWGARPGPRNRKNFARIKEEDIVLFYRHRKYFSSYRVTKKLKRRATELAIELWGTDKEGHTWDLVYFLQDGRHENIKVGDLAKIAGQGPKSLLRGLWILDRLPSQKVIEHYELAR